VSERYEWVPLTEEETWRNAGMGDMWERAEAGDPIARLLRERIRKAEVAMAPFIAEERAKLEKLCLEGTAGAGGLALLLKDAP
jgi:hypothetical protein